MSDGSKQYEQQLLHNNVVNLLPFDPNIHAEWLVNATIASPVILKWLAVPVVDDKDAFIAQVYNKFVTTDSIYAVFDKTVQDAPSDRSFAGIVSYVHTKTGHADTELGIIILPAFQGTHVSTNAVGLLLLKFLDPPSRGGFGVRRVQWRANAENVASRKFALRMGFEFEGICRWDRVLPSDKTGVSAKALEIRNGTTNEPPGRHSAVYSLVWDEWDMKRPVIVDRMQRRLS